MREYDNSDGTKYVKSIKDGLKRRFATEYLAWLRSGKTGAVPNKGHLPTALAKTITTNLDALA